jgi:hypothetical protein
MSVLTGLSFSGVKKFAQHNKILGGVVAGLAGIGLIAGYARDKSIARTQQDLTIANQQLQAMQAQAVAHMEVAAAGAGLSMPNAPSSQIAASGAEHMGTMQHEHSVARG